MLAGAMAHATISVTDMGRARSFYEGKLGLSPKGEPVDDHIFYTAGGDTGFLVYVRADAPKAENTAMDFVDRPEPDDDRAWNLLRERLRAGEPILLSTDSSTSRIPTSGVADFFSPPVLSSA